MLFTLFNGNREDMEDAEQEVLMTLYQSLPRYRGASSFKTYFYRLCRNRSIDILRKKTRQRRVIVRFASGEIQKEEDPEEQVLDSERRSDVLKALLELDESSRLLLMLKDAEGLPIKEIGRIMNLPEGTVKSRLHRTRSRAAEILQGLEEP